MKSALWIRSLKKNEFSINQKDRHDSCVVDNLNDNKNHRSEVEIKNESDAMRSARVQIVVVKPVPQMVQSLK